MREEPLLFANVLCLDLSCGFVNLYITVYAEKCRMTYLKFRKEVGYDIHISVFACG